MYVGSIYDLCFDVAVVPARYVIDLCFDVAVVPARYVMEIYLI